MLSAVSTANTKRRTRHVIETVSLIACLREFLVDTCHAFMGRVDARICYLINMLEGDDRSPGKNCLVRIERGLRELKLKPYKGRRRDLKRIEKLVEELEEILGV